jgi:hypothetical protein
MYRNGESIHGNMFTSLFLFLLFLLFLRGNVPVASAIAFANNSSDSSATG